MVVTAVAGSVAIGGLAQVASVAAGAAPALCIGLLAGWLGPSGALCRRRPNPPTPVGSSRSPPWSASASRRSPSRLVGWLSSDGTGPVFTTCAAICALSGIIALCSGSAPRRAAALNGPLGASGPVRRIMPQTPGPARPIPSSSSRGTPAAVQPHAPKPRSPASMRVATSLALIRRTGRTGAGQALQVRRCEPHPVR